MKFFKVRNSRSLILLIILKLMILEKFSIVSVEPFFRKKKIDFEEKVKIYTLLIEKLMLKLN